MEGSISEVGTPPPHNLDIPHGLVESITHTHTHKHLNIFLPMLTYDKYFSQNMYALLQNDYVQYYMPNTKSKIYIRVVPAPYEKN